MSLPVLIAALAQLALVQPDPAPGGVTPAPAPVADAAAPAEPSAEPAAGLTIEDLLTGAAPYDPAAEAAALNPDARPDALTAAGEATDGASDNVVAATPGGEPPPAPPPLAPALEPGVAVVTAPPPADAPEDPPAEPVFLTDNLRARAPLTDADRLYENRVLGTFHAAQGRQGSLDGRWVVEAAGGGPLYSLQLTDPGAGESRIEGAWRNLAATGLRASGFIDTVSREDLDTVFRFQDAAYQNPSELRVHPTVSGAWSGWAITPAGRQAIVIRRDEGIETAALETPVYEPPPPPPPKAKARPGRSKAKAKKSRRPAAQQHGRAKRR